MAVSSAAASGMAKAIASASNPIERRRLRSIRARVGKGCRASPARSATKSMRLRDSNAANLIIPREVASPAVAGLADRATGLVGWTIAWRAASAVTTLALEIVLANQLGKLSYGIYASVLSGLIYVAVLATFGQDQSLLRYLPEVLARGDRSAAYDLLRKSLSALIAVWLLTSAVVFLLRPLI